MWSRIQASSSLSQLKQTQFEEKERSEFVDKLWRAAGSCLKETGAEGRRLTRCHRAEEGGVRGLACLSLAAASGDSGRSGSHQLALLSPGGQQFCCCLLRDVLFPLGCEKTRIFSLEGWWGGRRDKSFCHRIIHVSCMLLSRCRSSDSLTC